MDQWWVIRRNRDPVGPVSTDLVIQGIHAGRVPADALVCELGGTRWRPIAEVSAFATELGRRAGEESVTAALPPRSTHERERVPTAKSARRRFDHAAERTIVDDSPVSSESLPGPSTERPAISLRPFDDATEQTVVEKSPLEADTSQDEERSTRRMGGLRRFDEVPDEQTIVDALPLRPSEPPS
jgi:hypothetical protein